MNREMKDSGIIWIGEIPKDWSITKVKKIFIRKQEKAKEDNPIILSLARSGIKIRDISNNEGQIAESYFNYNPVKKGDLILNPMDLYSGANCNVSKLEGVISPAYINLKAKDNNSPQYYNYYFKLQYWSMAFFAHGKGVSFDNRWTINNETVMNYIIPLPSTEEQILIANFLDVKVGQMETLIEKNKQLIEEYEKYKQSLISKTITKGLNSSNKIKDSGYEWIGEIPDYWSIKRLGFLGKLQNGISKSSDYFGFGYPFVSYGDVYKNIELPKEVNGLVDSSRVDRNIYSVKKGDVFFTRTSETVEDIGIASTCLETIENATFAGFLIRFRPSTEELSPNFSKYYFRSNIHRKYFVKEMNLVTRASLSQELLKKLPVVLPPINEQEEISSYLDSVCSNIDFIIKQKKKLIIELETYKKSLIYEAVTGKIDVRNYKENELEVE